MSIKNFDFGEDVGNLLTVGADILNRGGTGEAGDFGQSFDTSETFIASVFDNVIPIFAPHDFETDAVFDGLFEHALHTVDNNNAVETFIAADGVGAIAEDEGGKFQSAGEAVGVGDVARSFDF